MTVGYSAGGTYVLSGGTLSVPISDASRPANIGENGGGSGTFIQTGDSNLVDDRIGHRNKQLFGFLPESGTYTLGGSGVMIVNTLFVGSEEFCSGAFTFNTSNEDHAPPTISGTNPSFPGLIVGGDGFGPFVQGAVARRSRAAVR